MPNVPPGDAPWTRARRLVDPAGGVELHCVEAGDPAAPLVILLHGFPEFWYGWRHQIGPLAAAGLRVVAPDLRGYGESSKPPRVADYRIARLVDDVVSLIRATGRRRAHLVGHDWGGVIAWHAAMWRPDVVDRFVVLNAPHPAAYRRELRHPSQALRSWYALFLQLPWLPEALLATGGFAVLRRTFRHDPRRPGAFTPTDVERYVAAFSPRAARQGPINYYRAMFRRGMRTPGCGVRRIAAPTLLLWGEQDAALVRKLTDGLDAWVPHSRVRRFPHASHWLQHDEPEAVTAEIVRFLGTTARPG